MSDTSKSIYDAKMYNEALNLCGNMRLSKGMPGVHVQAAKSCCMSLETQIRARAREIFLADPKYTDTPSALEKILEHLFGSFEGLETEKKEMAAQKLRIPMVYYVKRWLGNRHEHSRDAEGWIVGPGWWKHDYCYDVPIEQTLRRMFIEDPRAYTQVKAMHKRMEERAKASGTGQQAYVHDKDSVIFDIPDGSMYRNHPVLGDAARRAADSGGPMKLALMLYYDDVEPANVIGAFRVKHKLGLFYYALIDLDPSIRMSLQYIQLVTVAYAKDVTRYGTKVLSGDPESGEPPESGSSFGACMRRLSNGVNLDVPADGGGYEQQRFQCFLHMGCFDFPARGALSCTKMAASAVSACPQCDHSSHSKHEKKPSSFLDGCNGRPRNECASAKKAHRWKLRTLKQMNAQLAEGRRQSSIKNKDALWQKYGLRTDDYPLMQTLMPYFDVCTSCPQDIMHGILEGIGKVTPALTRTDPTLSLSPSPAPHKPSIHPPPSPPPPLPPHPTHPCTTRPSTPLSLLSLTSLPPPNQLPTPLPPTFPQPPPLPPPPTTTPPLTYALTLIYSRRRLRRSST